MNTGSLAMILGSRFLDEGFLPSLAWETGFNLYLIRAMMSGIGFMIQTFMLFLQKA